MDLRTESHELNNNTLCFAKVRPSAIIPTKESENAGYDIYANFEEDFICIPAHNTVLVPTGIAASVSESYYLQVQERGSTGSKGMKYGAGVIDSGYRGEIFVALTNVNEIPIIISKLPETEFLLKHCYIGDIAGEPIASNDDADLTSALFYLPMKDGVDQVISPYGIDGISSNWCIYYPYTKGIAQLIVHDVPKMEPIEVSYPFLQNIPSERGTGALGSSGK